MNRLELPYQPCDLKLTRQQVTEALRTLRARSRADRRWWSIIDAKKIEPDFTEAALENLLR